MKRKFIFIIFLILFFTGGVLACNCSRNKFTGRWTEKISERVVMDVFQDKLGSEYKVFITWREDNLAQKEIYRFKAKPEANGCLNYQDGELVYRTFDKNEFEDKVAYTDGSGKICINGDKLTWTDNKDNTSTEFIKANKDLQKSTTVKNKMFTFTLPEELKGVYKAEIKKDKISIYHKKSQKAGFGGFALLFNSSSSPSSRVISVLISFCLVSLAFSSARIAASSVSISAASASNAARSSSDVFSLISPNAVTARASRSIHAFLRLSISDLAVCNSLSSVLSSPRRLAINNCLNAILISSLSAVLSTAQIFSFLNSCVHLHELKGKCFHRRGMYIR